MPPSPAMRFSPGRDIRMETHKRGRSLEGGILIKEKDDDLALFNEMQTREKDNFLLHSTDDLDVVLSTKFRYFPDLKLGVSIPARGGSSDLLNADGDKNDYDWLLTPPDTPLFASLDDETPQVNNSHRGRPRNEPNSTSRSASTEKSYRNSRGSASPHRLSPSPRSGNNTFQPRGRTLSSPHSSPSPNLRPTTPSRSPSTPPKKPSTPGPRSSTPDSHRVSTGSSGTSASTGRRGTSPVKASRGNSSSPKLQAWQSNLPGFSTEAPPNLRTSLADRPASYVRGSSPASRNGRGLSPSSSNGRGLSPASSRGLSPASRNGRESSTKRHSMSPTASRSASSSHSHDRDRLSSQSKGSVASSGDDDIDSLQSTNVSNSERSAARKIGALANNRAPTFTKTPSRISSSAPKRSFDSALRQMDRRSPQNMFRPLLSSVPSSTFYIGKGSPAHRPLVSRNSSSVTTSSNASSEQGASVVPDTEGSDHDQDRATIDHDQDRATEWGKEPCPDGQDEIFVFDRVEEVSEDAGPDIHNGKSTIVNDFEGSTHEIEPGEGEISNRDNGSAVIASQSTNVMDKISDFGHENITICSECGKKFNRMASLEENDDICPDCSEKGGYLPLCTQGASVVIAESTKSHPELTLEEDKSFNENLEEGVPQLTVFTNKSDILLSQDGTNSEKSQYSLLGHSLVLSKVEEGEQDQQVVGQSVNGSNQAACDSADQQVQHFSAYPGLMVDASEGVGISVLLKRSGSSKWPVVQGRSLNATYTPSDDLSYVRDSINSMRSSVGHGSVSASSSVDLSSSRQTEARVQRQPRSRGSSFSGIYRAHQALVLDKSTSDENCDVSIGHVEYEALEETLAVPEEKVEDTELYHIDSSFVRAEVLEEDQFDCTESSRTMDASASELSSRSMSNGIEDTSVSAVPNDDDFVSFDNAEVHIDNARSISDREPPIMNQASLLTEEITAPSDGICGIDIVEDSTQRPSSMVSEAGDGHECSPGPQTGRSDSPDSESTVEGHEPSAPTISENDAPISGPDSCSQDHAHDILEESTVTVEGPGGHMSRSLTFDEATDTILFCSSIIHSLAYQAASIGMEKENLAPLEGSRPTVTILGKSNLDRKDPRGWNGSNKHTPKSQKSRQRRVETDAKPTSLNTDTDVKAHGPFKHDSEAPNKLDSVRPLKLESKCNCTIM